MFVLLAVLWFSRDPKFVPGWEAVLHLPRTADGQRYCTLTEHTVTSFHSDYIFVLDYI